MSNEILDLRNIFSQRSQRHVRTLNEIRSESDPQAVALTSCFMDYFTIAAAATKDRLLIRTKSPEIIGSHDNY